MEKGLSPEVRLTCEPSHCQLWEDEHFRPGEQGPAQHPCMAARPHSRTLVKSQLWCVRLGKGKE